MPDFIVGHRFASSHPTAFAMMTAAFIGDRGLREGMRAGNVYGDFVLLLKGHTAQR